jgi:hypothetical protein
MGDRLTGISDAFMDYRIVSMQARGTTFAGCSSQNAVAANDVMGTTALAYCNPLPPANPTSLSEMAEMAEFTFGRPWQVIKLNIPRSALLGGALPKWYRTRVSGSTDDQLEYQGALYFVSAIDPDQYSWDVIVSGVIEFQTPVETSMSLKRPVFLRGGEEKSDEPDSVIISTPEEELFRKFQAWKMSEVRGRQLPLPDLLPYVPRADVASTSGKS